MACRDGRRRRAARCHHGRGHRQRDRGRPRYEADARACARGGRREPPAAHFPRARGAPQGARPLPHRAQGGALHALLCDWGHQGRFVDRHRRRHWHALRVREQGDAGAPGQPRVRRWWRRGAVEERRLRGAAHLHASRGRGGAHQRLQFSGVGNARETRPDAPRRRAGHREAGDADLLPRRESVQADHRVGDPAGRIGAADLRRSRGPLRAPHLPGRGVLHGLGGDGARAPPAPDRARQRGAVHLRDRFAQLLDPRSRRRARVAGARLVRAGGRARDDGEGGAEVHRDPKSHHPRAPGRGCPRRAARRARQGHRRRSAPPERQDGTGGLAGTTPRGARAARQAHSRSRGRVWRGRPGAAPRSRCRPRRLPAADAPLLPEYGGGKGDSLGRSVRAGVHARSL